MVTYRADPQETRETLLLRAARTIASELGKKKNNELSATQAISSGDKDKVMMLASISTMASWTELRKKLSGLPMVDKVEVLAISPQQVDLVLHFRGDRKSLGEAIAAQKIRLVQNPSFWVVSRE